MKMFYSCFLQEIKDIITAHKKQTNNMLNKQNSTVLRFYIHSTQKQNRKF